MKKRSVGEREKTAFHEAGHAVAAFLVRRRFSYVSIKKDEDEGSLGHVRYLPLNEEFRRKVEYEETSKIRPTLEKGIKTALAGHAAEIIFSGRENWEASNSDVHTAFENASYVCGSTEETEAYVKWLWIGTRNTIKQPLNWAAVEGLAEELLKKEKIGYKKAREIIRESMSNAIKLHRQRAKRRA